MVYKKDIAFIQYVVGLFLLVYNLTLYLVWNIVSRNYRDRRYRAVCVNVVMLIVAFIYSFGLQIYARSLIDTEEYHVFLNSFIWHWRNTPILLMFSISSVRLTRWAVITGRLYLKKKKMGEDFNERKPKQREKKK